MADAGRWLSPDWSAIPAPVPYANLTNPQTLNLYAMVSDNPETFADLDGHVSSDGGPYNLETANFSEGGPGAENCDYMGGDCSQKLFDDENSGIPSWYLSEVSNSAAAQQQNVTITYDKGVPAMKPALARYVTKVLNAAGIKSVKISATTNGKHAPHSLHYKGEAVDIHVVNGTRVVYYHANSALRDAVNAIQGAANDRGNGVAREDFGPAGLFKNGVQINDRPLQEQHENHIHIATPDVDDED